MADIKIDEQTLNMIEEDLLELADRRFSDDSTNYLECIPKTLEIVRELQKEL